MSSRRPGAIYVIRVRRPGCWWTVIGYVGQTRQFWKERIEQHRKTQPWGDTIVESYVIWESKRVSDVTLTLIEFFFIRILLPLYNDQHNRMNPRRIPAAQAKAAAKGRGRRVLVSAARSAPASSPSGSGEGSLVFAAALIVVFVLAGLRYMGLV